LLFFVPFISKGKRSVDQFVLPLNGNGAHFGLRWENWYWPLPCFGFDSQTRTALPISHRHTGFMLMHDGSVKVVGFFPVFECPHKFEQLQWIHIGGQFELHCFQ
jgi:hypothetical protein